MNRFRVVIPRADIAPIQVFASSRNEAIDLAKTYLGFLSAGHVAQVYQVRDELALSIQSRLGKGGYEFDEVTLDSPLKVVETKEAESQTPEGKETQSDT